MSSYFLAPTRYSTPAGAIKLGNIIEDPRSPEIALNDTHSEALQKLATKAESVDETNTFSSVAQGSHFRANILSSLLDGLANMNASAGSSTHTETSSIYDIEKLITLTISPTLGEITEIFKEPVVQQAIKNSWFRANVYMITSIRIVYGARVFASNVRSRNGFLHVRADLTPTGVPANFGADVGAGKNNQQMLLTHVSDETPFVIAYRVRELVYRRKELKKQRDVKGEIMSAGNMKVDQNEEEEDTPSNYMADLDCVEYEDSELPEDWDMKAMTIGNADA